jgi:hypothetical protein
MKSISNALAPWRTGMTVSALLFAATQAQGFAINMVDAGGIPGVSQGNPITWAGGGAYNHPMGGNLPPSPSDIYDSPGGRLAYDSYVSIDGRSPSTSNTSTSSADGYQCQGPSTLLNPTATPSTPFAPAQGVTTGPSSLSGVWFNTGTNGGFVRSGRYFYDVFNFVEEGVMIAQITLRPGVSELSTVGLNINLLDYGTGPLGSTGMVKFGINNPSNNNGLWGGAYYLHAVRRPNPANLSPEFAGGNSYLVFVVSWLPAPGGVGLAGVVGFASMRRQRR